MVNITNPKIDTRKINFKKIDMKRVIIAITVIILLSVGLWAYTTYVPNSFEKEVMANAEMNASLAPHREIDNILAMSGDKRLEYTVVFAPTEDLPYNVKVLVRNIREQRAFYCLDVACDNLAFISDSPDNKMMPQW